MEIRDFVENVDNDPDLTGVDMKSDLVVKNSRGEYVSLSLDLVVKAEWPQLREMIEGTYTPPLYHVSRIVGYYSRIENWNKSKLGELRDRRQGDYAVPA